MRKRVPWWCCVWVAVGGARVAVGGATPRELGVLPGTWHTSWAQQLWLVIVNCLAHECVTVSRVSVLCPGSCWCSYNRYGLIVDLRKNPPALFPPCRCYNVTPVLQVSWKGRGFYKDREARDWVPPDPSAVTSQGPKEPVWLEQVLSPGCVQYASASLPLKPAPPLGFASVRKT